MAVYGLRAKAVSMGKGQSAVHTAAYNARCQLHDDKENRETKNYAYKGKAEFSGIFAPTNAPEWVQDRQQLWNRATAAERQANGQPARNVEFSIPHELNAEQRRRLVVDFVRETFARRGMVADVSIHVPHDGDDKRNYHAHCLLTMRRLEGDGFAKTKERDWNKKEELEHWREKLAVMGAKALERAGHPQEAARFRHGHETLLEQRGAALRRGDHVWAEHCQRDAGIHKGPAQTALERRNDPRAPETNIGREAREIEERNNARADLRTAEKDLTQVRKEADLEAKRARERVASPEPAKRTTERPEAAQKAPEKQRYYVAAPYPVNRPPPHRQAEQTPTKQQPPQVIRAEAKPAPVAAPKQAPQQVRAAEVKPTPTPPRAPIAAPVKSGLKVAGGAGGAAVGLVDFVLAILGGGGPKQPPDALAQMEQQRKAIAALSRIRTDLEMSKTLSAADIQNLTPTHLAQIASKGDDYVRELVERMERDRERERDWGRSRER